MCVVCEWVWLVGWSVIFLVFSLFGIWQKKKKASECSVKRFRKVKKSRKTFIWLAINTENFIETFIGEPNREKSLNFFWNLVIITITMIIIIIIIIETETETRNYYYYETRKLQKSRKILHFFSWLVLLAFCFFQ